MKSFKVKLSWQAVDEIYIFGVDHISQVEEAANEEIRSKEGNVVSGSVQILEVSEEYDTES